MFVPPRPLRAAALLALTLSPLPDALRAADGDPLGSSWDAFDDGTLDTDTGTAIAVRRDGRILQLGSIDYGTGGSRMAVAQYLANGGLDPGFGTQGEIVDPFGLGLNSWGSALVLLPSGDAIVGGSVEIQAGRRVFFVGKLTATGIPHELFGVSGEGYTYETVSTGEGQDDELAAIAVDRFGRIVMVGTSRNGGTDLEIGVARVLANGIWDDGFSGNGNRLIGLAAVGGPDHGMGVAVDLADRIVIAAATWDVGSGSDYDVAIVALEDDGDLDATFDGDGILKVAFDLGVDDNDLPRAVAIWPDREIVVAGSAVTDVDRTAWFLLSTPAAGGSTSSVYGTYCGSLASPCTNGPQETAFGLRLQGDGKIVFGGTSAGPSDTIDFGIARYHRALTPDTTFSADGRTTFDLGHGPGADANRGLALAFDHDGRLVLGGSAEWSGSDTDYAWARFDSSYIFADGFDGSLGAAAWSAKVP
jgi:uncharacterized delta-60 repeat protein